MILSLILLFDRDLKQHLKTYKMQSLTLRLEQLQTIDNSNRTPEEKELLTKAAKGEIKWTKEVMDLYMKAVRDTEE